MSKRKTWFLVLAVLALVALVVVAIPKPAQASIGSAFQWTGTTYSGYDDFYNTWVYAYEEGATASVTVPVSNFTGNDITIQSAAIEFDWGEEYAATDFPSELKNGENAMMEFSFTVPSTDVASNSVVHAYRVKVVYTLKDNPRAEQERHNDWIGTGDGATVTFGFTYWPVVPGSVVITLVDYGADTRTVVTPASFDYYAGTVTLSTAPAAGVFVYADYRTFELLFSGNSDQRVGYTNQNPVAEGSETVCLVDYVLETLTTLPSDDYTVDYETGRVTLDTAPSIGQSAYVTYTRADMWTRGWSGYFDFAVYSADQADAQELEATLYDKLEVVFDYWPLDEMLIPSGFVANGTDAEVEYWLGYHAYEDGDFAGAKTHFETGLTKLQAAMDAYVAYNEALEDANVANTNAETALFQAEAELAQSEAGKAHTFGNFMILIGVAAILVGIGGLLWGVSRLIHRPTL